MVMGIRIPQRPSLMVGRFCILGAALMWSSAGFLTKYPVFNNWTPEYRGILFAFWRAMFVALMLLPLVRRPRFRWALLPSGVAFGVMSAAYLSAAVLTTATNAIWLQETSPWWVLLFGVLFLRERPQRADWVSLLCGTVGVATILFFELRGVAAAIADGSVMQPGGVPTPVWGVGLGLISGIAYGGVVTALRYLRDEPVVWLVFFNQAVVALLFLPAVIAVGTLPSMKQTLFLVVFGVFQMGFPYLLMSYGLRTVRSLEAVMLAMLEPLLVPLWAWFGSGEVPAPWTLFGGAWILVGLLLHGISHAKPVLVVKRL